MKKEGEVEIIYSERHAHDIISSGRLVDTLNFWEKILGRKMEAVNDKNSNLIIRPFKRYRDK